MAQNRQMIKISVGGDADPNESCLVNMYLQPDGSGGREVYGLPTIISTRDEALHMISRLHPSAHVHFTVLHPRIYNQFGDAADRRDANKQQVERAKADVVEYMQVLKQLDKVAKEDPTTVAVRDSYVARNAERIDMLKYMIHVGERIVSSPVPQRLPAPRPQQPINPPPPYTP